MARLTVSLLLATWLCVALVAPAHAQGAAPVGGEPGRTGVAGAVLSGLVVDQNQTPIDHARITIETGQWTSSASDGSFRLDGIAAGSHTVTITARGHHTGSKTIEFAADQQKTMLVMLTSNSPQSTVTPPAEKRGTFYVQAYEYRYGSKRYYVKHVEVTAYDDPSKSWSKYRWTGNDGPGFYMPCEDATLGKHFNVTITWHTMPNEDGSNADEELTGNWYKKFDYEWETWTFYNPY